VSRKPDGTQRSGRFTAPPAAGAFGGADTAMSRLARPFVPKPFRSTGGMSASADTMMSIGMGRHNIEEEIPEDQVNIASIVDRKTSDRRYLPKKLGNMKKYLHTTPLEEALNKNEAESYLAFSRYEKDLNEYFERIRQADPFGVDSDKMAIAAKQTPEEKDSFFSLSGLKRLADFAAPFVPIVGDLWYGYRAYESFGQIQESISSLQQNLKDLGVEVDLFAPVERNVVEIREIPVSSPANREALKQSVIKISLNCIQFLNNTLAALPLELFKTLKPVDFASELGINVAAGALPLTDPDGLRTAGALLDFSERYISTIGQAEQAIRSVIPGDSFENMHSVVNLIGNLALIRKALSMNQPAGADESSEILPERRLRRKKRANEMSTTAGVAGYAGPMQGPRDPQQFYSTMAKAAGSEYLVDPVKKSKPRP